MAISPPAPRAGAPLSDRLAATQSSPVRELLQIAMRPEIISLAGGLPAPDTFDVAGLKAAFDEVLSGPDAIRAFLPTGPLSIPRIFVPVRANGQLAFGTYRYSSGAWERNAIHVITLDERGEIADAIAFLDPDLFPIFGLDEKAWTSEHPNPYH